MSVTERKPERRQQTHKVLAGRPVAERIRAEAAKRVADLREAHWSPKLVSIAVGSNEPAKL